MSDESTEIVSTLSSLKKSSQRPAASKKSASGTTGKKSPAKKKTKAKSASSSTASTKRTATKKSSAKKKSTTKKSATPKGSSTKRSTKKPTTRTTPTLRADLKKYADERYDSEDLINGVTVVLSREGTSILRDALAAVLASKVPLVGEMLNDSLVDDLVGKLTDDYKKVKAAERKGIRALINWLDGEFEPGDEVEGKLVSMLNGAQSDADRLPELSVSDFVADATPKQSLKPLR